MSPFRRPRGMQPLPEPVVGGSLAELRAFVHVREDEQCYLLAGWLLGAFRPAGRYLVLVLTGEQDSAKSTTGWLLRLLVDPNEAGDQTLLRAERSLLIAAANSRVLSSNPVSTLADWQSDAFARIDTGAGCGTCQLGHRRHGERAPMAPRTVSRAGDKVGGSSPTERHGGTWRTPQGGTDQSK